jgi:hypothetical protein
MTTEPTAAERLLAMLAEWRQSGANGINFGTLADNGETEAETIGDLIDKAQQERLSPVVLCSTREVQFVLRNGDRVHACLAQDPHGSTRLHLYSDNGNLIVMPSESRAVRVTTQTQFAGEERAK